MLTSEQQAESLVHLKVIAEELLIAAAQEGAARLEMKS